MKKKITILIIILISFIINTKNIKADTLPRIYLDGNINMTNEEEKKIKLEYISENLEFTAYTKIKYQGNSSLRYEKKNYTIKLYENETYNNKKKIDLGFGEEYKYHLKANWIDNTHSRNIVTSRIAADIWKKYNLFENTPNYGLIDGFPIEVYTNDEFLGLYTLNITKNEHTYNMDKNNPNHVVLAYQNNNQSNIFNEEANFENWEIEIGPETEETLNKLNRVINFIKNSTDEEFKNDFENYLNLDATLNYYTLLEFAQLKDNITKNVLMITYDGIIWYPTLYDLDTSWGTNWEGTGLYDYNEPVINKELSNILWQKFKKNFSLEIANRYFELRKDILTKDYVLNEFHKFYNIIPTSTIKKEKSKWKNPPGYDFTQIEEFLDTRIPITDNNMYELYNNKSPKINFVYSTTKKTIKPVTITLIPNRKDIILIKNGKKSYNYTYTFKENGEYTFEYTDWYGNNLGTIKIKVDWIITDIVINISLTLLLIISSITLYKISKKKKEKFSNPNKENTKHKKDNNKDTANITTSNTKKEKKNAT